MSQTDKAGERSSHMKKEVKVKAFGKEKTVIMKTREPFAPTEKPMKKKNAYIRKPKHKKGYSEE